MNSFLFIRIILLSALLHACTGSSKQDGTHPVSERLPADNSVQNTINLNDFSKKNLDPLFNSDSIKQTGIIGKENDLNREYYKTPSAIGIDQLKAIYVAHPNSNLINVYSKNGNFKYSIGGNGRGPGEFQKIINFDFNKDYTKLYVLDSFEIEIFEKEENKYQYKDSIPTRLQRTYDLCVLENGIFVSGYGLDKDSLEKLKNSSQGLRSVGQVSGPIVKFNETSGEKISSFGYKYKSFSKIGITDGMLSRVMLSCNKKTKTVVSQMKFFPFMFGYNNEGERKWTSKVNNFESTKVTEFTKENGRPGLYLYSNEDIFHRFYPFREMRGKYALTQIYYSLPQKHFAKSDNLTINRSKYYSVLVNTQNGKLSIAENYNLLGGYKHGIVVQIRKKQNPPLRELEIYEY